MKRPKTCLFCGTRANISKEHIWPEWLAPQLEPAEADSHITEFHSGEGKQPPQLVRRTEKQGPVHTKKVRAVCAPCNNGWMSVLESEVKPILVALIEQPKPTLTSAAATSLSRWVAVKAIVAEHAVEGTALTPYEDRSALRTLRAVPPYFRIFVAKHSLATQTAYYRQATTVSTSMRGPDPPLPPHIRRNIQAIALVVGSVCFYISAARVSGLAVEVLDPVHKMHRIWPDPTSTEDLTSLGVLRQPEIYAISRSLDRLVRQAVTSLRPIEKDAWEPYFVLLALQALRHKWRHFAVSTRKDPNITKADIARFLLPRPTLDEQKVWGMRISKLDSLIAVERATVEKMRLQKLSLLQVLLTESPRAVEL